MSHNPLLMPVGLPDFENTRPEHVEPAIRQLIAQADAARQTLEKNAQPNWSAVEALTDAYEPLMHAWGVVNHLMNVANSAPLREAHQAIQAQVIMCFMRASQSQPLFEATRALRDGPLFSALSPAQQRTVDKRLLDARLSGLDLQGAARQEFNTLEQELSELETRFGNNVLDATKAWALTLTRAEDVAGLPQSLLAMTAAAARAAGDAQATAAKGPWRLTLDFPVMGPFMKHAQRRDLREQVYRAFITRASEGTHDNTPVMERILVLRARKAALLGFKTYAELSLATKMAPGVSEVDRLLEELRTASLGHAQQDLAELQALQPGSPVALWDVEFLSERLREARFNFTEEELRPYFPLPVVLEGLFALLKRLFGITVTPANGTAPVWHKDVMFFHVDRDGQRVASFYLDAYSRPENKRGGAWADECISRRRRLDVSTAPARLPVGYLCCNQTPPVEGKPSLMTFREVETLFHEFGHGLQHMLTTVDVADVSGMRGVEWDAVELPSQFMENWCYHEETLLGLAQHVDTGAKLPLAMFEKLKAAKTFRAASIMLRQIYFSALDLELHHRFTPGQGSIQEVQQRIASRTTVLPPLAQDRFLCGFTHIFAGGYAAGYYSYKWAEVLSADAFSAFEDAGLSDATRVAATGRRFRDTVLALGGSAHPMEVFAAFRGRGPQTTALLRHNGLAA